MYINEKASSEIQSKWHSIKASGSIANKVDFFRYVVLFNEGGLYTDIDTICLRSFDGLLERHSNATIIVGYECNLLQSENEKELNVAKRQCLALHTFLVTPKHKVLETIIHKILEDDAHGNKSHGSDETNDYGTHLFHECVMDYNRENHNDVAILGIEAFSNGAHVPHSGCTSARHSIQSFSVHIYSGTWITKQEKTIVTSETNTVCKSCNRIIKDTPFGALTKRFVTERAIEYNVSLPQELDYLSIYMLFNNNEKYCNFFSNIKDDLQRNINVTWYIYENGSTDNTSNMLQRYFGESERTGNKINLEILQNCDSCGLLPCLKKDHDQLLTEANAEIENETNRFARMSLVRERLFKFAESKYCNFIGREFPSNAWCLLVDTDIMFTYESAIKPLLDAAKNNADGVMFCANTSCVVVDPNKFDNLKVHRTNCSVPFAVDYYYDTLAYNYGSNYPNGININFVNGLHECLTAFGGVVLIRREALVYSSWIGNTIKGRERVGMLATGTCEHWAFCENVRKCGKIYIVENSKALWGEDNMYGADGNLSVYHEFAMSELGIK